MDQEYGMDHTEDIKALYAGSAAQAILLAQLYAELFAARPEARQGIPEMLLDAAIFKQRLPGPNADKELLVDIQAQMVLSLRAFFTNVEAQLQRHEAAVALTADTSTNQQIDKSTNQQTNKG